MPIACGGALELPVPTVTHSPGSKSPLSEVGALGRKLRLTRLQLEQDSGKTNHSDSGELATERCLVDLNRAGVALVEFVFEPDLRRSAAEINRMCNPHYGPSCADMSGCLKTSIVAVCRVVFWGAALRKRGRR
jgi:Asp-tRNA(Asn)/Glu-tRNA(Gln) amidotransferase B subunit